MKQIIITGGNGYIGQRLCDIAKAQGRDVVLLGRNPDKNQFVWKLGDALPSTFQPSGQSAVIHLAHDWKNSTGEQRREGGLNLSGTQILLNSARQAGVKKFVFVSSQSSRKDAANIYGRVKWQTENLLHGSDCVSARVGLVYGGPRRAMFGLLNKLVSKLPILPMLDPWREVQPIHLDEVCRGLLALADSDASGWRGLAGPVPIAFGKVLRVLAREAHGRSISILAVPLVAALFAANIINAVPFLPKIDKERILGLAGTQPMSCAEHLTAIGLTVLPMEEGVRKDPLGRRGLLAEGKILLHYAQGRKPARGMMKRYAQAVRILEPDAGAIGLSPVFFAYPFLLRFIEPLGNTSQISKRFRLAAHMVDASCENPQSLSNSHIVRLLRLSFLLSLDMLALPFRILATLRQK